MTAGLTDDERKQWDVDPDLWPRTPPFHVFRALMDEDDNTWWRAGSGHGLNAYEAAVESVDALRSSLLAVMALHQPVGTTLVAESHAPLDEVIAAVSEGREAVGWRTVEPDSFEEIVSRDTNCMVCQGYPTHPCETYRIAAAAIEDA